LKQELERWNLQAQTGVQTAGMVQIERYVKIGISSLNDAFDVFELKQPMLKSDLFE